MLNRFVMLNGKTNPLTTVSHLSSSHLKFYRECSTEEAECTTLSHLQLPTPLRLQCSSTIPRNTSLWSASLDVEALLARLDQQTPRLRPTPSYPSSLRLLSPQRASCLECSCTPRLASSRWTHSNSPALRQPMFQSTR